MSPQQGLPLMTPSMPGFSFHPFPQTPPLLPQFLSPGLGPFSPPLMMGSSALFGTTPNGPSSLRHNHSGFYHDESGGNDEATPLQSPARLHEPERGEQAQKSSSSSNAQEASNYFPNVMTSSSAVTGGDAVTHTQETTSAPVTPSAADPRQAAIQSAEDVASHNEGEGPGTPTQSTTTTSTPDEEDDSTAKAGNNGVIPRRASFLAPKTPKSEQLEIAPAASFTRGASLDIPRPMMDLGSSVSPGGEDRNDNGSGGGPGRASPGDNTHEEAGGDMDNAKAAPAPAKRGWNLAWLKK